MFHQCPHPEAIPQAPIDVVAGQFLHKARQGGIILVLGIPPYHTLLARTVLTKLLYQAFHLNNICLT